MNVIYAQDIKGLSIQGLFHFYSYLFLCIYSNRKKSVNTENIFFFCQCHGLPLQKVHNNLESEGLCQSDFHSGQFSGCFIQMGFLNSNRQVGTQPVQVFLTAALGTVASCRIRMLVQKLSLSPDPETTSHLAFVSRKSKILGVPVKYKNSTNDYSVVMKTSAL